MPDHVHMFDRHPTRKYAVSQVVGFIKGKSAIHLAMDFIRNQEKEDQRLDQLNVWR